MDRNTTGQDLDEQAYLMKISSLRRTFDNNRNNPASYYSQKPLEEFKEDLRFMGYGVSRKWLSDDDHSTEILSKNNLPCITNSNELASQLRITPRELKFLAYDSKLATQVHYRQFPIPKRSGGKRIVSAPKIKLKRIQRWINENILANMECESPAHGFVQNRSIVTNAQQHVGKHTVINIDLKDFFPSIVLHRAANIFAVKGYSPAVSMLLALLSTDRERTEVEVYGKTRYKAQSKRTLPQGAPTSPALANQVAKRLDRRLSAFAEKFEFEYTRYADDLTFSSKDKPKVQIAWFISCIEDFIKDEGFKVNARKTKVFGREQCQMVTGLVVNDGVAIKKSDFKKMKALLNNAKYHGLESQQRDDSISFNHWYLQLDGYIAFVEHVKPEQGRKLRSLFTEISQKEGLDRQSVQAAHLEEIYS